MTRNERRDMFAAAALQGLLASGNHAERTQHPCCDEPEDTVGYAVSLSDEMLRQLDAEQDEAAENLMLATGLSEDVSALRAKLDAIADVVVRADSSTIRVATRATLKKHLGDHYDAAVKRRGAK